MADETVERDRFVEIDLMKAIAIVVVVFIHAIRPDWDPRTPEIEMWLGRVTRFAVPCFLFASGFLYATREPVPWATTRRRLRRIGFPYLVASVLAQVYRIQVGEPSATGGIVSDFLLGGSFGAYYYVLQIFVLALATPLFARLCGASPGAFAALVPFSMIVQFALDQGWIIDAHIRWYVRNPLAWWSFFLVGWWVRLHYAEIVRFVSARRAICVASCAGVVAALAVAVGFVEPQPERFALIWALNYAMGALLFVMFCGASGEHPIARRLSDASYAIYLFHLFFLLPLAGALQVTREFRVEAIVLPWLAGLVGSLLLIAIAQRVLGARSRDWIGA